MPIKQHDLDQLTARLGRENVLTSEADLLVYSTDVGAPPALVDVLVNRQADAVARCKSIEDVETVVGFCKRRRIPMTPRAAATSALGGAVPKRGGVVIDLTGLRKDAIIDEAASTVLVDAGMVVATLNEKLNAVGLELPCYPTSALAATIGGFVAMNGHGVGSTRHGNIGKHVVELIGVGADGERFHARDREQIVFYLGMGGSTGIITQIKLKVIEAASDKPVLATFVRPREVQAFIEEARKAFPVKHIAFHNPDFFALRTEGKGERKNPLAGKWGVTLCFPEPAFAAHEETLGRMVERHGGALADDKTAAGDWAERFFPIRAKRLGPSLVAGESMVPVEHLAGYLLRLRDKTNLAELAVEGHITDDGRVYFFIYTLDDERRPMYPLAWGASAWIVALAKKLGGGAYHPGVWLQWEAKSVFGKLHYKKMKGLKKQADPRHLMNPGMVFPLPAPIPEFVYKMSIIAPTPAPSLGFQLAAGNPVLQRPMLAGGGMYRAYRRHKSVGVLAADAASDMGRGEGGLGVHTQLIWGCDIPSLQAIPNPGDLPMTQTPRGKMVLAKAFARGKITDPWSLKPALDVADPLEEEAVVCHEYPELLPVFDALRRAVTAEGVELDVKAVEVVEEAAAEVVEVAAGGTKDVAAIKEQAKNTPEAKKAWVLAVDCIVCNGCEAACPTDAAIVTDIARVDRDLCIADGACFDACPTDAIRPGVEDRSSSAGWPAGSRLAGKFGS